MKKHDPIRSPNPLPVLFHGSNRTWFLAGDYRIATLLGVVQGLGEFLPISSSAHLIIVPWLFDFEDSSFNSLTYDVSLHLGTTLALLHFFWRDWLRLGWAAFHPRSTDGKLFWLIGLASVPGAAAGYMLDDRAETTFRSPLLVASTVSMMGAALYLVDRNAPRHKSYSEIGTSHALAIGLAQALALVPGVSRSGATITMGRLIGLKRDAAARFSFLLATPITVGAMLFKLKDLNRAAVDGPFVVGIAASGLVGAQAIRFLLHHLHNRSHSFLPFVIYRFCLAALILTVYLLRRRLPTPL